MSPGAGRRSGRGVIQRLQVGNPERLTANPNRIPAIANAEAAGEAMAFGVGAQSAGELFSPAGFAIRQQGGPAQLATDGTGGWRMLAQPLVRRRRRPGDMKMQTGELGKKVVEESAQVSADQLPILPSEQGLVG